MAGRGTMTEGSKFPDNGPGQRALCSQGRQGFQSPVFPGLRVGGSLEAGIVDWEQRYGPSAASGDLRARLCADMAEKCLYYSLLVTFLKIRCVNDEVLMKCEWEKRPWAPPPSCPSRVILGSVLVHTHKRFVRRGQIISSLLRVGSNFLNSLSLFPQQGSRSICIFIV